MLPESGKTMAALTPGPEEPEKQENGADDLSNPAHARKPIRCTPWPYSSFSAEIMSATDSSGDKASAWR